MGIIGVALNDENGTEIHPEVGDTHLLDAPLGNLYGEELHCLRYIDPYGDTVFNRLQLERLDVEWAAVDAALTDPETRNVSHEVRRLIASGRSSPHQYLKFSGD